MAYTVLATSDEKTIFVGKDPNNKIGFGKIGITSPVKGRWTSTRKSQILDITSNVLEAELIDEEKYRTAGKTAGWGLVGLAVAGPLGAAFGGYFGGKKDNVVCAVKLKDGRSFLAQFTPTQYRKVSGHLTTGKRIQGWKDRLSK